MDSFSIGPTAVRAFYRAPIPSFTLPSDSTNTGTSTIAITSSHIVANVPYTSPTHIHIQAPKHKPNNYPERMLDSSHSELDIGLAYSSIYTWKNVLPYVFLILGLVFIFSLFYFSNISADYRYLFTFPYLLVTFLCLLAIIYTYKSGKLYFYTPCGENLCILTDILLKLPTHVFFRQPGRTPLQVSAFSSVHKPTYNSSGIANEKSENIIHPPRPQTRRSIHRLAETPPDLSPRGTVFTYTYTSTELADLSSLSNPAVYENYFPGINQMFATQHGAIQTESVCNENVDSLVAGYLMSITRLAKKLQAENSQLKAQLAILTTQLESRNNESLSDEGHNEEYIEDYIESGTEVNDENCVENCIEVSDGNCVEDGSKVSDDNYAESCTEVCDGNCVEGCDENYVEGYDENYVEGCDESYIEDFDEGSDENYAESCTKVYDGNCVEGCEGNCNWDCDIVTTGMRTSLISEMSAIDKECDYILQELDRQELSYEF